MSLVEHAGADTTSDSALGTLQRNGFGTGNSLSAPPRGKSFNRAPTLDDRELRINSLLFFGRHFFAVTRSAILSYSLQILRALLLGTTHERSKQQKHENASTPEEIHLDQILQLNSLISQPCTETWTIANPKRMSRADHCPADCCPPQRIRAASWRALDCEPRPGPPFQSPATSPS